MKKIILFLLFFIIYCPLYALEDKFPIQLIETDHSYILEVENMFDTYEWFYSEDEVEWIQIEDANEYQYEIELNENNQINWYKCLMTKEDEIFETESIQLPQYDIMPLAIMPQAEDVIFITQPKNVIAPKNKWVQFYVTAANPKEITSYLWEYSTNGGSTWKTTVGVAGLNDQKTRRLYLRSTAAQNGWMFRCKVTTSQGTFISDSATLTYDPTEITLNKVDQSYTLDSDYAFTVQRCYKAIYSDGWTEGRGDQNQYILGHTLNENRWGLDLYKDDGLTVTYLNVGTFRGKKVNLKETLIDWEFASNEANYYSRFALYNTNQFKVTSYPGRVYWYRLKYLTIQYDFEYEDGTPVYDLKGNATIKDIDYNQGVILNGNIQEVFTEKVAGKTGWLSSVGREVYATNNTASTNDDKYAQVTFLFDGPTFQITYDDGYGDAPAYYIKGSTAKPPNELKTDIVEQMVLDAGMAFDMENTSAHKFDNPNITKSVSVSTWSMNDDDIVYTMLVPIPPEDYAMHYNMFRVEDEIDPRLEITSYSVKSLTDNANATTRFDITIDKQNKIIFTAKDAANMTYYGKELSFEVHARPKDINDFIENPYILNSADVYSDRGSTHSNEVITEIIPSTPFTSEDIEKTVIDINNNDMNGLTVNYEDELIYKIRVHNPSSSSASIKIKDIISDKLNILEIYDDGILTNDTITWDFELNPNQTKTVSFKAKVIDEGIIRNKATLIVNDQEIESNEVINYCIKFIIQKEILNTYEPFGNPSFIFKITDDQNHIWYRLIDLSISNTAVFEIPSGINQGIFKVEELTNGRYTPYSSSYINNNSPFVVTEQTIKSITLQLDELNNVNDMTLIFQNKIEHYDKASHMTSILNHISK